MRVNLDQMRSDLRTIIQDLRDIEHELRRSFNGIGQDLCANCVSAIADHYEFRVQRQLNRMDQNDLSKLFGEVSKEVNKA